jgi:hypothetical protein
VGGQEGVAARRTPGTGGVGFHAGATLLLPALEERREQAPGGFGLVAADEERAVTDDAVEDQALVRFGRVGTVGRGVAELRRTGCVRGSRPGTLELRTSVVPSSGWIWMTRRFGARS